MIPTKYLILGGVGIAAALLLSRPAAAANIGQAIGGGAVDIVTGVGKGFWQEAWVNPYAWAREYEGHIPIIDPIAKSIAGVINLVGG